MITVTGNLSLDELGIEWSRIWKKSGDAGFVPDDEIRSIFGSVKDEIAAICRPSYCYRTYPIKKDSEESILVSDVRFNTGKSITSYLEDAEEVIVFTCSAGEDFENYTRSLEESGDFVKSYFADLIGSEIAEFTSRKMRSEIRKSMKNSNLSVGHSYCPGYCEWKLCEQKKLFSLLPPHPCGITLLDSCLMLPVKSISGMIGIGKGVERKPSACSICNLRDKCNRQH